MPIAHKEPLNVWCVFWGTKYSPAYVYALREALEVNLRVPFIFRCMTDEDLPFIDCVPFPDKNLEGWWNKMQLFASDTKRNLYFDLDVIITGSLIYLEQYFQYKFDFSAPSNWAASGFGGIQSSVMAWDHRPDIWEAFNRNREENVSSLYGDQEFIYQYLGEDWNRIEGIYSFKYHCLQSLRGDERVVVFHGKPDPHETVNTWTWQYTITLRNLISLITEFGLLEALKRWDIKVISQPKGDRSEELTSI